MEYFIIWLVVGAVSAFLCHRIAVGKGRSGTGVAILGFVIPLVGIIVALVLPRRSPA